MKRKISDLRQSLRKREQQLWEQNLSTLGLIYIDRFKEYVQKGLHIDDVEKKVKAEKRVMPKFPEFITKVIGDPTSFNTTIEIGQFTI